MILHHHTQTNLIKNKRETLLLNFFFHLQLYHWFLEGKKDCPKGWMRHVATPLNQGRPHVFYRAIHLEDVQMVRTAKTWKKWFNTRISISFLVK